MWYGWASWRGDSMVMVIEQLFCSRLRGRALHWIAGIEHGSARMRRIGTDVREFEITSGVACAGRLRPAQPRASTPRHEANTGFSAQSSSFSYFGLHSAWGKHALSTTEAAARGNKKRTSASGVERWRRRNPHNLNETYDIMTMHVVFVRQCLHSIHSQFISRSVCSSGMPL